MTSECQFGIATNSDIHKQEKEKVSPRIFWNGAYGTLVPVISNGKLQVKMHDFEGPRKVLKIEHKIEKKNTNDKWFTVYP